MTETVSHRIVSGWPGATQVDEVQKISERSFKTHLLAKLVLQGPIATDFAEIDLALLLGARSGCTRYAVSMLVSLISVNILAQFAQAVPVNELWAMRSVQLDRYRAYLPKVGCVRGWTTHAGHLQILTG